MFSYIKGILEVKNLNYVVIDVNGIGFKIFMSESAIQRLEETGNTVKIYTHMNVKEDDLSLYGFITNEELRMFELLIGVSGVGAKSAISMLSSITPSKFALAVISNDVKTLTKIPGIGPKSAQRIILELKDKLKTEEAIQTNNIELKTSIVEDNKLEEAVQALKVLGYTRQEIESVLAKIEINTLTVEDIIRKALSFLGM
ncbi:MAG TPA: Holliday junction branch migration protein RuvA [Clostridiaceae bacterium]|nr:Holliday junction branch migration protein RuvA [Clostridium sp.]MEE0127601.1 Holliday junction branch migration protein RuvA [Clostridia bacterium]HJJ12370.1 Holliday junction branch migration protein RuvA [Clostridiaceae bacterium]